MMTDVATVSSQVTAQHAAGVKGAGAAAATGTVLDGAFAALLGAAGQTPADSDAATDGKIGQPVMDPALIAGDPSVAVTAGSGVTTETGEAPLLTGDIDPATGKPRKGATRGKDAAKGDDVLLQAQAALVGGLPAPIPNVSGGDPKASVKAGGDGVAIEAGSTNSGSAVALAVTAQAAADVPALAAKDSKGDKPAKDGAKAVPTFENVATAKDAASAQNLSNPSRQPGDEPTDGDGKGARNKTADQTLAANDDSVLAGSADPLRDIVQSLPPVVQSQLSAVGAAGAGRPAATGEVLSNHAIDMSVSGQWIDRMAREIATVADGSGHARFQLNPPSLGRIQVDLWRGDDQMNVRLLTETDEAARRLREGQAALEAHARVASLSLGSVSVEKSSAPLDSGDKQNQRQGAEQNGTMNQQAFAQTQGQSAQARNNNSNGNLNRNGAAAVIGSERQAEPEQDARTTRAGDPRVRFA
jgi:flagellar hook-length control protein FliK